MTNNTVFNYSKTSLISRFASLNYFVAKVQIIPGTMHLLNFFCVCICTIAEFWLFEQWLTVSVA